MSMLHRWEDFEAEPRGETVSKRSCVGENASLVRLEIKAGTQASRHSHPFEQFVQVLSGSGTLETKDGKRPFAAGSLFHFPVDAWHAASFDEDTVLVETNLHKGQTS